ncbi:MAG: 4-(cytidine 5'-diphospho)-2-C-methyl-D-erythritol kinase, partial [Candidatus Omnitrophota bacterium]
HPSLPTGRTNLVYKAARLLMDAEGVKGGIGIDIKKNIPVAAGLGGGSSNAACALLAVNRLFGLA